MNHYERLGVPRDASLAEIRDAYRRRARLLHPDHAGSNDDEMASLNEAYFALRDVARRSAYDRTLPQTGRSADASDRPESRQPVTYMSQDATPGQRAAASARRFRALLQATAALGTVLMILMVFVALIEGH